MSPLAPTNKPHDKVRRRRTAGDMRNGRNESTPTRKIELPWKLARPEIAPVDGDVLAVIDPDLAGVPVEFVVHKLRTVGPE